MLSGASAPLFLVAASIRRGDGALIYHSSAPDPWATPTAVLYNGPSDPAVWPELIARFSATIFATVPSLYRRMLKYGTFYREGLTTLGTV